MNGLEAARLEINRIDREMAELFEARMRAVESVAEYKIANGLPVFDASRENEIIKINTEYISEEKFKEYYISFLKDTMSVSKSYQRNLMNDNGRVISTELGYGIIIERGALSRIGELLPLERRVLVVTDSGVPAEYAKTVADAAKEGYILTLPQGEKNKTLDFFEAILSFLIYKNFTRTDCVVAVGGGVVGDMAGFAAACYMRGIDFYNIPTTLLSEVDSSIGGKTAVDLNGVKNAVGVFYQPKGVIIDPDTLKTLPARQISAGLAEAIKMAATSDAELFRFIENSEDLDADIEEIIYRSLLIKKKVVETDPTEKGLRKVLNFGHTLGHAIESAEGLGELYHGECVALGMLPFCSEGVRERLVAVLKKYGLPTEVEYDKNEIMTYILHDKKMSGDEITVVYVDKIGSFEFKKMKAMELKEIL